MSTSYYWKIEPIALPTGETIEDPFDSMDPRIHIGKTYYPGGDMYGWIWAQEPAKVRAACEARRDDIVAVDEYGKPMTGQAMLAKFDGAGIVDTDSIGAWFG